MNLIAYTKQYFIDHLPVATRHMHYLIILLVIFQILISGGMHVSQSGYINGGWLGEFCAWAHFIVGLLLVILAIGFAIVALKIHGLRYFFPYFYKDFRQIKLDLAQLIKFKLPEVQPGGLAASVQGLGLGALLLVVLSGLWWFVLWQFNSDWAGSIRDLHKALTTLIELYIIAHGGSGILHIVISFLRQK